MLPRIALAMMTGLLLARSLLGAPVEVNYTGKVVDERYQPIANAKVTLIGTPLACSTDASGAFVLKGALPADALAGSKLPPLEFTAAGHFAKTFLPDSAAIRGIVVSLDSLGTLIEGQPVDIGRFGYAYLKGRSNNPPETQWLLPVGSNPKGEQVRQFVAPVLYRGLYDAWRAGDHHHLYLPHPLLLGDKGCRGSLGRRASGWEGRVAPGHPTVGTESPGESGTCRPKVPCRPA